MSRFLENCLILSLTLMINLPAFGRLALAQASTPCPQMTVRIYNYAQASPDTLTKMASEASLVLKQAEIDTVWLDCRRSPVPEQCHLPQGPTDLVLRIVTEPERGHISHEGLGFAFASKEGGKLATLFHNRIQKLAEWKIASAAQIMGAAAAHEIGHLLLATMAHSPTGMMRANWEQEDLRRIAKGALLFTPEQCQLMRGGVFSRIQAAKDH